MNPHLSSIGAGMRPRPPRPGRRRDATLRRERAPRGGFTLVELLVVVSIVLVLTSIVAAAIAGGRANQKKSATAALIEKLDEIIMQQYATYGSRRVQPPPTLPPGMTRGSHRSWFIRRNLVSGDLPDRWADVQALATGVVPPQTNPQRAYADIWNSLVSKPTPQFQGAECLFMIVMQGGIADCLDCGELKTSERGDKDGDGAFEFWDEWGNPIAYILWPAALELPQGVPFFSGSRSLSPAFPPASTTPPVGLGMRPLIYSAGPDGEYGLETKAEAANLTAGGSPAGRDCGNPAAEPTLTYAQPLQGAADNITNFDAEVAK